MFYKIKAEYRGEAAKIFVESGYAVKLAKRRKIGKDGRPLRQYEYGLDVEENDDCSIETKEGE